MLTSRLSCAGRTRYFFNEVERSAASTIMDVTFQSGSASSPFQKTIWKMSLDI